MQNNNRQRHARALIIETLSVYTLLVGTIYTATHYLLGRYTRLITPCLLVLLAVIPYKVKRLPLPVVIGGPSECRRSLKLVGYSSLIFMPLTFLGCWILSLLDVLLPLTPDNINLRTWISYCLYSLLYIAVGEEFFFRGYIQNNIRDILVSGKSGRQWLEIVFSASAFSLAHICVYTHVSAAWTFLPGLLFAWLYTRTHTLMAPILMHGLANGFYFLFAWYLIR